MKKTIIIFTVLAIVLAAIPAMAKSGPAPKATGEISTSIPFFGSYIDIEIWFNAHDNEGTEKPDRGKLYLSVEEVDYFIINLTDVEVDGNKAYFSGPIVESTDPSLINTVMYFSVQDNGTPGRNGDLMSGSDTGYVEPNSDPIPIDEGNIKVH